MGGYNIVPESRGTHKCSVFVKQQKQWKREEVWKGKEIEAKIMNLTRFSKRNKKMS